MGFGVFVEVLDLRGVDRLVGGRGKSGENNTSWIFGEKGDIVVRYGMRRGITWGGGLVERGAGCRREGLGWIGGYESGY